MFQMIDTIQEFFDRLAGFEWFSKVGEPIIASTAIRSVASWEDAFRWCEHPVSKWCNIEGKKALYEALAQHYYEKFREWNKVADAVFPEASRIVEAVTATIIPSVEFPERAKIWIKSQILSAAMELYYSDCINVRLFRDQLELYQAGRFPCGWFVNNPKEFPIQSVMLVY
jgi:hypothetical protein